MTITRKVGAMGYPATKDNTSETNVRNLYCLFFLHLWCSATLNYFLSLRDEKGHKKTVFKAEDLI